MRISDWSSDVCSSDLRGVLLLQPPDQLERLVGGDASRDDQENPFSGQHGGLAQISRWTDVNNLGVRPVEGKLSAVNPARPRPARATPGRPAPRSEEHTSELQSLMRNSYADFCLKKKKKKT